MNLVMYVMLPNIFCSKSLGDQVREQLLNVITVPSAEGFPSSLVTSLLVGFCPRARMMSAIWL